jgi:ribosomal protein S12 methylthiotransferase accessory factor
VDPPEDGEARPITLGAGRKTFTLDGGHRVRSPEATLQRYEHLVSPITGVVARLERAAPVGGVLHTYVAGSNVAIPPRSLRALRTGLRSRSGGKGITDLQARASALCEGLERHSGIFRGDEPRRRARMRDLGEAGIHPNACLQFSERQYQERTAWNRRCSPKHMVPLPFDEDAVVSWTPVWSLTRRETRFLPTAFCFYRYPVHEESAFCVACSNGNAAGNTLEEAILQGFLELVERDAVGLWWYNRLRKRAVALESFDEPYLHQVQAYLRTWSRDLRVLELTSDLGIPAFVAVSRRTDGQSEQIMLGFGAHLDARIGVLRAVTELNQLMAPLLSTAADRTRELLPDDGDPAIRNWLTTARIADHPYLVPDPDQPPMPAPPGLRGSEDLREDVLACQALVERHGMEMLVLDQTRPDIGLPVVKVIVPGLRHFWPRFAPGRLYQAPVRAGWRPAPLTEEQLNPVMMVL